MQARQDIKHVDIAPDAFPMPPPRMTLRGILIAAGCWCVYSIISAIPLTSGTRIPFLWALSGQIYSSVTMALLSIPVWLLVVRRMNKKQWCWKLAAHMLIIPFYAAANYGLYYQFVYFVTDGKGAQSLAGASQWIILYNGLLYVVQFSLYHGIQTFKTLRFNEQQALRLMALNKEQQLAALKAQINPHFLFNTLNSISAMTFRDAEETRSMIAHLGDLLRYSINASKKNFVPLKEELAFIQSYLALEAKRLGERLRVEYHVQPEALDVFLLPMTIQPLVENAIKHGIEPSENGGILTLTMTVENNRFAVSVKDTGAGFRANVLSAHSIGIGLSNTNERLQQLFGEECGLWTNTPAAGGFEVGFSIPIHRETS